MRSLLGVVLFALGSMATERKQFLPADHGVGRLRALMKKFHKDFEKPIDTHMQLMDEKSYERKEARQKYIQSFVIE